MLRNRSITGYSVGIAWLTSVRYRASYFYISNRKRVEMFMGKRFHLPTRLRTAAPDIASEWNYEKNPMHIYPEIIGIGYVMSVWWKCSKCGHVYEMSVEKRVVRGGGCEICAVGLLKEDKEKKESQKDRESLEDSVFHEVGNEGDPLPGEANTALRPKRPAMLNIRTKY
ncbi:unnamed protein product [Phytomonas sp. Hart1]|nr:unnamed protein product [Phytomonas sp. Hart1]|eukprot:CCW66466.1 unnamed protein product [Phytomonas sp. isolate Hart1]